MSADAQRTVSLPELREPRTLCLPGGRLDPAAVGWSRRHLLRTNLPRTPLAWGRNKRWEYWGITTPQHVIGLTISSLDYAGVHQFFVLDRATGEQIERGALAPFARGVSLPDSLPPFTARASGRGYSLEFVDGGVGGTARLRATLGELEIDATVQLKGDALAVVVPWSETRYQYTVKAPAQPVTGTLTVAGVRHDFGDDSFAVLDRGRGRWPYSMQWNWGAGSGVVDGRTIGLQVGGRWTEGTGSTENAVMVDGVAEYLPDELAWEYDREAPERPWRVSGDRLEVTLTPFGVRRARTNALVIDSDTRQAFGVWRGFALRESGEKVVLDGIVGWAEDVQNRW